MERTRIIKGANFSIILGKFLICYCNVFQKCEFQRKTRIKSSHQIFSKMNNQPLFNVPFSLFLSMKDSLSNCLLSSSLIPILSQSQCQCLPLMKMSVSYFRTVVVVAERYHHTVVVTRRHYLDHCGIGKLEIGRLFSRHDEVFCAHICDASQGPIGELNERSGRKVEEGIVAKW